MRSFWLVAWHEYRKMTSKRSFMLATLGMPLLILGVMGISILAARGGGDAAPVGYVDHSGILGAGVVPDDDWVEVRAFAGEEAARAALEREEIQAYYVLPADYLQTRRLDVYYLESPPTSDARQSFEATVRANLISTLPGEVQARLVEGAEITTRTADGSREIGRANFTNFVLPFIVGFFFVFAVIGSAGYLLQVVADEKENRTMEIMITSLSPLQLIGGKMLGLVAVSLTQMALWLLAALVAVMIGAQYVEFLRGIAVPWEFLLVIALFFLPSYLLVGGMMTAIGAAVTEVRQGQQIAGILNLLFMFPYFLTALLVANPNSPILVGLTLFPTTALVTISLRWGMTVIPMWQLALSWLLLVGAALGSVLMATRIFRAGMLRYGQPLSARGVLAAVRAR
jgi:ABC-2 type transport system permease protein